MKNITNNSENPIKTRYIFWIVILAAIIILSLTYQPKNITLAVENDILSCSYTSEEPLKIQFSDIISMNLVKNLDIGEYISGVQTKDHHFGIWKNDQFEEYALCSEANAQLFMVIDTTTIKFVINFESDDSTENFYGAFIELLKTEQVE